MGRCGLSSAGAGCHEERGGICAAILHNVLIGRLDVCWLVCAAYKDTLCKIALVRVGKVGRLSFFLSSCVGCSVLFFVPIWRLLSAFCLSAFRSLCAGGKKQLTARRAAQKETEADNVRRVSCVGAGGHLVISSGGICSTVRQGRVNLPFGIFQ